MVALSSIEISIRTQMLMKSFHESLKLLASKSRKVPIKSLVYLPTLTQALDQMVYCKSKPRTQHRTEAPVKVDQFPPTFSILTCGY